MKRLASNRRGVTAVGLAAVLASTAIATGILQADRAEGQGAQLESLSNRGTRLATENFPSQSRTTLHAGSAEGAIFRLAVRGDRAFYKIVRSDGTECFADGYADSSAAGPSPSIGRVGCPYEKFPSAQSPVLDFSSFVATRTGLRLARFAGITADGVSAVVMELEDGRSRAVPVVDNVYFADNLPATPVVGISARNRAGDEVYSREFPNSPGV